MLRTDPLVRMAACINHMWFFIRKGLSLMT
jgi:hypothetical protein